VSIIMLVPQTETVSVSKLSFTIYTNSRDVISVLPSGGGDFDRRSRGWGGVRNMKKN